MPETSALDENTIRMLLSLGSGEDPRDFLRELVALYLSDTPTRIADMEEACRTGDPDRFARAAHSLKGSSANIGATALAALAGALEQQCRERGLGDLGDRVPELRSDLARTLTAFEQVLAEKPLAN